MQETLDIPRDPEQEQVVPAGALKQLMIDLFVKKGMFAAEAEVVADRLLEADLRGIHSHGSRAAPRYLQAMDHGDIDPRGGVQVVRETGAIAVIDGGRAVGHLAATRAMETAIEKAKLSGTGTVVVRNGQHFGAAAVYVLMAAKAGMIGYCTTSTGWATVAAYGSRTPATANPAIAWGIPVRNGAPIVLDMACAVSSWGKVHSQLLYGRPIPAGWALDVSGEPTTDPKAAKTLLPAAGARGYGLALVSGILTGPLVGNKAPIHKTGGVEREGSEHFFYCIDVAQFTEIERFYDEIESTARDIRGLEPASGFDRVRLPGEMEWERTREWSEKGIPLHKSHLRDLEEIADKLKVKVPW